MSRAQRDVSSRKLIDHIVGAADLGPPRALLATTFDLNPEFFELDFLPSLLRLPAMDDRRARSRVLFEGELAKMEAVAVLMEATRYNGRPKSLRIDLRPAKSTTGGVVHAKVTLLVHDEAVRLVVASANLTSYGYRENREVALALTADKKNPEAGALVRQLLLDMPLRLAPWWSPAAEKVAESALAVLDAIRAPQSTEDEAFLWGGGEEPLWRRVLAFWPEGEIVTRIRVVSPFWSDESGNGPLSQLVRELRARGALAEDAEVLLISDPVPDTTTDFRPTLPVSYGTFDARTLGVKASVIAAKPQVDEEDVGRDDIRRPRRLHAKVLLLEGPKIGMAYAGSANFTLPGWGFGTPSAANVEAGIVLRRRGKAREALGELIPPTVGRPIPLDGAASASIGVGARDDEHHAFPTFLRAAELQAAPPVPGEASRLDLVLDVLVDRAPSRWSIALELDGSTLLDVDSTTSPLACYRVRLSSDALNKILRQQAVCVRWTETDNDERAFFPVNVTLDARQDLPFGDPEAFPGENELVAFYQGRIAWEDVFPLPKDDESEGAEALEDRPTNVDTSKILSYQVRAFVEALHGIRAELRSSLATAATMRLGLLGPVSPVALARQVHTAVVRDGRSPTAGAFQLVELLACVEEARSLAVPAALRETWSRLCGEAATELLGLLSAIRARDASHLGAATSFHAFARAIAPSSEEVQ